MKELTLDYLERLPNIFENSDRIKHVLIISTIKTFVQRFEKYPELKEKAKLYLGEFWEEDGTFILTFQATEIELSIFFDTTNDKNHEVIKNALKTIKYNHTTYLFAIRNEFRQMALDLKNELNLDMTDDTDTACFRLSKENASNFDIEIPPNFEFKSLSLENVDKVNSLWPHRYEGSDKFLEYSIKYHISVGLFDGDKNLIAWCLRYDNGSLAILQVDDKHLKKGFGSLIVKEISKKIAKECDLDVTALIVHKNFNSKNLFSKLGFEELGGHTWFGFKKK